MRVCRKSPLRPNRPVQPLRNSQSVRQRRCLTVAQQATWQKTLVESWQSRSALTWLLYPISLGYGVVVRLRRWLYRIGWLSVQALPVPVIVVGNVIAGGAGKTPVVIELVQHLRRRGLQVGVISRGYGRRTQGVQAVTPALTAQEVGDEPALIQRRSGVPVYVGTNRVDAARALLAAHPETHILISDDGLQHLALARDVEVIVFDERGTGNGWLLPAGPLREPWPRGGTQALVLRTTQHPRLGGFVLSRQLADFACHGDGSIQPLAQLATIIDKATPNDETVVADATAQAPARAKPLLALGAIARPEAFFAMLHAKGIVPARTLALPDHFDFSRFNPGKYKEYQIICTEKDAVKLWPICPDALAVPLVCDLPAAFWQALNQRLEPLSLPHGHTIT